MEERTKLWLEFACQAHRHMQDFKQGRFGVAEACRFMDEEKFLKGISPDIREFIANTIVGIAPDFESFDEVVQMLNCGATEEEFEAYMNAPPGGLPK